VAVPSVFGAGIIRSGGWRSQFSASGISNRNAASRRLGPWAAGVLPTKVVRIRIAYLCCGFQDFQIRSGLSSLLVPGIMWALYTVSQIIYFSFLFLS
jgi:hypothetical protein